MAASMMNGLVRNSIARLENLLKILIGSPPPSASAFDFAELSVNCPQPSSGSLSASELFGHSILWGVPRNRRTVERRAIRKHAYNKIIHPKRNILTCDACGHYYEAHTICGNCYDRVSAESEEMKSKISASQSSGPIEKHVVVLYEGEEDDKKFYHDANVVEMPKPRPSWFSKNLLSLSSFDSGSLSNTLKDSDNIKVQIKEDSSSK